MLLTTHSAGRAGALVAMTWLVAVALSACPATLPRFVPAADRADGLPDSVDALIAVADAPTASTDADPDPHAVDRALAALDKAAGASPGGRYAISWRAARANALMATALTHSDQRRAYAADALLWAERAAAEAPDRVEGVYFSALATALVAETEGRLELASRIIELATRAVAIDPAWDRAAAHRLLGAVYATAPSWPTSVGSAQKAVEHMEQAVALSDSALNHIFLGQAYYVDEEYEDAKAAFDRGLAKADHEPVAAKYRKLAQDHLDKIGAPGFGDEATF